ncbi:tetratricopeptide repeat protein [Hyalangium rubrum]|uniref:Tetratricopeptide repeat protein n=1 Tax=Hyalangium rubrum TaxID=3103134 RepID=A0ABU5HDJ6_9BACT|nr:tetratricopeptide repeat protein [Hyalangium sp. s54d21]MDY7231528.1 tetratricopeptide repeat protein [Hyalangium sp. s54d21]
MKLMTMGLLKEAAREFDGALAKDPQDATALLGLARLHLAQHRPNEARPLLERLLALHPQNPEARGFLARLKAEGEKDEGALNELRALAKAPKAGFTEFYNLGHALLCLPGKEAEAAQAFVQALKVEPKNPHATTYLGVAVWRQGQLPQALKCFKYASTLATRESLPLQLAAKVLVQQGEIGKAQLALQKALQRAPRKAELHEEFIKLSIFSNNPKAALQSALELRQLDPKNPNGPYLQGLVMLTSGKVEDARRLFREALVLAPDSWEARLGLARALQLGADTDVAQARKLLEEAVARAPTEPGPVNELAVHYLEKPETAAKAKELLGKVLETHPDEPGANLNMALALAKTDKAAAAQHARKAQKSTDPSVREQAERLLKQVA